MATTDRPGETAHGEALADRLREATFATLLARADGASVAAAGILAATCEETGTPYQASAVRTRAEVGSRTDAADEGTSVLPLGLLGEDGPTEHPSVAAYEAAEALGADPDPALALAGVVAGGGSPEDAAPSIVDRAGFERRPGLGAPTGDLADGLAHTTLAHAPYSGDPAAAEAALAGVEDDADRRAASLLAIDAVAAEEATERAAAAIERAIHPLVGGPLKTVEGYADVLCALAATAPGTGVTLAIGADVDPALDAWRDHAVAAHEAVRTAETERHAGLLVARTDGPVEAVARLLRDFRSPEPAVLAVGEAAGDGRTEAALATVQTSAEPIEPAAEAAGGSGLARGDAGYARFDAGRTADLVDAVGEAV